MSAPVDPSAPILLFDSGVGGLSVLAELRMALPDAPLIYAADNAGLPYGTKTEAQSRRASRGCGGMTQRFHPRLVCIACNTASTIALGMVREVLEVPIVGTVPAIKPAAALTQTGVIGLLGTEATIRQGYIDRLEHEFAHGKRLLRFGAPDVRSGGQPARRSGRSRRLCARGRRSAPPARRRGDRHRGAGLHALPAGGGQIVQGIRFIRGQRPKCASSMARKGSPGGSSI